ncbi:hypothetical protein NNC19_13385 [Clostridium sp. SHJSY1]|uniref:hypothetical protein n=1 Tax=Clostridium sp. SHJSY1 TaxID=2942483 RepID=UPI00287720B2|nr:hypothetical protein [Clostridium sp. SHJSY1]MDS0526679.1 hypothetical protein [Clostridium sp. SHJSY1]
MSNGCKKESAESVASRYIEKIELHRDQIIKNFTDMNIENADAKDYFENIIKDIKKECNDLIDYIHSIRFN